jgi:hypothetical protein
MRGAYTIGETTRDGKWSVQAKLEHKRYLWRRATHLLAYRLSGAQWRIAESRFGRAHKFTTGHRYQICLHNGGNVNGLVRGKVRF